MLAFNKLFLILREQHSEDWWASIDLVPRNIMGMKTSLNDVPPFKPYGFWVDKSGNFAACRYQQHYSVGKDIIRSANRYLEEEGKPLIEVPQDNIYGTLFRAGWIRVTLEGDQLYYESGKNFGHMPTQSQIKFMKYVKDLYKTADEKYRI